jgi:calcineurin-like phosphoesterase family protein
MGATITPGGGRAVTTWFTADLHLGHHNIIDYCNRPFHDVHAMNDALVENWNEAVAPGDTVWVVGDFALGKIADTLPLVSKLHGRKILVAGNHDRCWAGHGRRADGWTEQYLDAGFDEIVQGSTRLDIGGVAVVVCHFPYRGDSQDRDRYVEHRPIDKGDWLLHGHVHDRWAQHGRMINVGVDARSFRPIDSEAVEAIIREGPAEQPILPASDACRTTTPG